MTKRLTFGDWEAVSLQRYIKIKKALAIAIFLGFITYFLGFGFWGVLLSLFFTLSEKRISFRLTKSYKTHLVVEGLIYEVMLEKGLSRSDLKSSPLGNGINDSLDLSHIFRHDVFFDKNAIWLTTENEKKRILFPKELKLKEKAIRKAADKVFLLGCFKNYKGFWGKVKALLEYRVLRISSSFTKWRR